MTCHRCGNEARDPYRVFPARGPDVTVCGPRTSKCAAHYITDSAVRLGRVSWRRLSAEPTSSSADGSVGTSARYRVKGLTNRAAATAK